MKRGKIMTILTIVLIAGLGYFKGMGIYSNNKEVKLGVKNNQLLPCGDKPNCVSTTHTDEKHNIEPIKTNLSFEQIINELTSKAGLKIIRQEANYAHFTYSSSIMGYVDDIEIMKKENELLIRSASRVGYSDLGANRERVEKIRELFK